MKDIGRLAIVLTVIAAGAGLILSVIEAKTREPIAEQRRQETLKAIRAVLPPADNSPDSDVSTLVVGKDRKGKDITRTFYRGRVGDELSGIAFKVVSPNGYSGNIEIMVGIQPDGAVTGIEILQHAETPGLGDKISTPQFKNQFIGKGLGNADWRVKKDGGEFDQITGATISPRAVVSAVKGGLQFYEEHREEIVGGKGNP